VILFKHFLKTPHSHCLTTGSPGPEGAHSLLQHGAEARNRRDQPVARPPTRPKSTKNFLFYFYLAGLLALDLGDSTFELTVPI